MTSRNRREGVSVGHDAFLDIVANLVGILIILVVVLGAQSQQVIREVQSPPPKHVDPRSQPADESAMNELAVTAARAASAQSDSIRLEKTIKHLDAKIAREAERRTILLTLLTKAEEAWEAEQADLESERREASRRDAERDSLQDQLNQLVGERQRLEDVQPQVIAITHLPTPMAKTVFGKEVYFRLKGDRISVIPFEDLAEEIGQNFRRTSSSLREGISDAAVGPIRGYVARYVLNRSDGLVANNGKLTRMSRARVVVASFEPLREPYGTPIEEVLKNDDWLDVELAGHEPAQTTITVAVYPDSYGSFRKLREKIYAKGFATAARPIKDGNPIYVNFSGGGSRSVAQ